MSFFTIDHAFPPLPRVTSTSSQFYSPRVSRRFYVHTSSTEGHSNSNYPLVPMIGNNTRDLFADESKTELDSRTSVNSSEDERSEPVLDSTLQLFQSEAVSGKEQWRPGVRDWLVFICIVTLAMMDAFDATVLIPVLPELANAFDEPLANTLWINTAYLVLSAASQLFFTMACEVFSHGPLWIVAVLFSTFGTGICGGSMSLVEMAIGRSMQGIGGGGALSLCFVVMSESTPESIHPRYSSYILLTRLIGSLLGPIVGGLFVDFASWAWAFYANFIFCALGMLVIPFAIDLRVYKNIPLRRLRALDWTGATLAFLGPTAILIGLSRGGISYGWNQWQTYLPISTGIGVLLALVVYEYRWALHPHFGARVFQTREMAMTYLGCFCHGFVILAQLQFFALYFISTKYFSMTLSGLSLLAITGLAVTPAALVGIILVKESQCSKYIIAGGWTLIILASACSILLNNATPTIGWVFLFFSAGLGHGLLLSSYNIRSYCVLKDDGDGAGSTQPITISNFMRAWGMAFAIPVGGVVFLNVFGDAVRRIGLNRGLINTARGYIILMSQARVIEGQRGAVQDASALALQAVWEVITVVAVVGGISSVFLWKRR